MVQDTVYTRCTVPFLACGDLSGWDADRSYAVGEGDGSTGAGSASAAAATAGGYVVREPVQKPVHPAYKTALEQRRNQNHGS